MFMKWLRGKFHTHYWSGTVWNGLTWEDMEQKCFCGAIRHREPDESKFFQFGPWIDGPNPRAEARREVEKQA